MNWIRGSLILTLVILAESHQFISHKSSQESFKPGNGYFGATKWVLDSKCVKAAQGDDFEYTNMKSSISTSQTTSSEQLDKVLNTHVSGSGSFGLYSASGEAQYAREIQSTKFTIAFNYAMTFETDVSLKQNVEYGELGLSNSGLQALKKGEKDFIQYCGDHYIESTKAGAVLIATVKIEFSNSQEKQKLDSKLNTKAGLTDVMSTVNAASKESQFKGSIKVMAKQFGGKPTELATAIGDTSSCSYNDIDACQKLIHRIQQYASQEFTKQITFENAKPVNAESLYYFSVGTVSQYKGNNIQPVKLTQEVIDIHQALFDARHQDLGDLEKIKQILASQLANLKFDPDTNQIFAAIRTSLENREALYTSSQLDDFCFGPQSNDTCQKYYDSFAYQREQLPYDREILHQFFFDCFSISSFGFVAPISKDAYQYFSLSQHEDFSEKTSFVVEKEQSIRMEIVGDLVQTSGTFYWDATTNSYNGIYETLFRKNGRSFYQQIQIKQVEFPL